MEIKPFLHEHYLLYDRYENEEASCDKCNQQIRGWAYSCESCPKFWLHSSCAKEQLPPHISHPLHSQHLLTIHYKDKDFICDKCCTLSRGHRYRCTDCNPKVDIFSVRKQKKFQVDVSCAASTNDATLEELDGKTSDEGLREIPHFVHKHPLTGIFNYRKVGKKHYNCVWCEKHLSGMTYACFKCLKKFYIHESCLIKIPTKILGHPFHLSHPLYMQRLTMVNDSEPCCYACKVQVHRLAYHCRKCEFSLHVLCSRLQPSLNHEIHEHSLTYFEINNDHVTYQCNICHKDIDSEDKNNSFYRCVKCDLNFHFGCIEIPSFITHEYHRHGLILVKQFEEDDSGTYYCDICEEERNANYYIYCCEECIFISHIQCALNKVGGEALIPKLREQEETEKGIAESRSQDLERQIEHFTHGHPLSYYEKIEKNEDVLCKVCTLEIYGQAYGCESCKHYLHNPCAKLAYEVLHPLHPQHPLHLYDGTIYCHECRGLSAGFGYLCPLCGFALDVKCVTLTEPNNEVQRLEEIARESKLCPLQQDHELSFLNFTLQIGACCSICFLPLSGLVSICSGCDYVLHESCLGFPQEMALPFHPEHPLHPILNQDICCLACRALFPWKVIVYNCRQCEAINLHLSCANSLWRAIEPKSHQHPLFYFGTEFQNLFASMFDQFSEQDIHFKCHKCNKSFSGIPFYRCVYCDINFHLKCVPIPQFVKSKYHIHPFTLRDCFKEDDLGKYFCDVCEEERHPKDHVYFCEECQGLFVAHIECVLHNMVEEIAPAEEPSPNLVSDLENTSIQAESEVSTDESTQEQQSDDQNPAMKE